MAKEEPLELEGVIDEILPGGQFRVKLDSEHMVLVYTAGKMRKHRIRSMVGDRVTVEMTPYDLTKGRINFRHKDERAAAIPQPRARPPMARRR
jgi:translation initiation factor IF-1